MKYVYIDIKTTLSSSSIQTVATSGEFGFALADPSTGEFILQLPRTIEEIPSSGIIYEDAAVLIRT